MKYTEIKGLTVEELRKKNTELKNETFEMRMKNQLGQLANPLKIRANRRDISRIKSALTQKLAK